MGKHNKISRKTHHILANRRDNKPLVTSDPENCSEKTESIQLLTEDNEFELWSKNVDVTSEELVSSFQIVLKNKDIYHYFCYEMYPLFYIKTTI